MLSKQWDDPKAKHTKTIDEKFSTQVTYGRWWGEFGIGLEDLGQRPKGNLNEDSEGISLVSYTTTGCATWG